MFRKAENRVRIEGILAETDIKYNSFVRNGETVEAIGGKITVLVEQSINGEAISLEIPVHMFSSKLTRAGKINPAYESIEKVMKEFVSIAACGSKEQADRVRITNAELRMNEFPGQNGAIVSQPRVTANFVSRAVGEFKPEASFTLEFMVSNIARAMDAEGVELDPPKLNIQVAVPQFTPEGASALNIDVMPLVATSKNVVNAIEGYWEAGRCYKASGRLNFSSRTEEVVDEVDFGEAQKRVRTISVSELVVTGGSQAPMDEDFAWTVEEIQAGNAARKQRLEDMKNGTRGGKKAPAPMAKGKIDLGF